MKSNIKDKKLVELYNQLLMPRLIEERMLLLLRQGKISKWFSGIGQEAISVGITAAVNKDDFIFPMHRNLGVFTTRNMDLKKLFCQLMGKKGGFTKSRDRSFHFGSLDYNLIGMISHLAAMLPVACGVSYIEKITKSNNIAIAFVGDGATSEGDFHEALNLAAVWSLPVIFVIENNGYGLSTPNSQQYLCKNLADRGIGYGIESMTIDGNNILEVYNTFQSISKKCRKTKKPFLVEALTFRMRGHEEASGIDYVPKSLIKKWEKKDPITLFEKEMIKKKIINKDDIQNIKNELIDSFSKDLEFALNAPIEKTDVTNELKDVYKPINKIKYPNKIQSKKIRFVDAISNAIYEKMKSDNKVLLMGQDIADYGGVFKISKGFLEEFGIDRVKNTPIIESGIIGAAMGMSLRGYKPIVEMQFADFVSCGFNQIVNNLAKTYYRWDESINVTVRMPTGGGMGAGPFHSQNIEAWFTHVPGLKIVYPSNPVDAKGLLISSIDDPNPVLFFEHKGLYRSIKSNVMDGLYSDEIGKGKIIQKGSDLSIITYGLGVHWALEATKEVTNDKSIEIIDLRSLIPWDKNLVLESIKKTGRVMVLHEATITSGFGAEIAATISKEAFEYLDAPIERIGSLDTPTPFAPHIEKEVFWNKNNIYKTIISLLEY
ncbi:MAG: dehydrogenase [Candidatus Marinimicrobia bacterium]|nr:dehydrogenase [Candidatus Neomarinimicrobiota bacterium]|tara:strand:- start:2311 stop:4284 length:1974 start_codon:yes stop_codon:yes gene_type:complete